MSTENIAPEKPKIKWFIDLGWYEQHNRTFIDLARRGLCPKCMEKLGKKKKPATQDDIIAAIKDCCSETPDFITVKLPIMESAFRIILANGNQPLSIEEISQRLFEKRESDTYTTSPEMLSRLLRSDRWYGFKQVGEEENPKS